MSCNGQRQGFIITCASYNKEIAMAAQSNLLFGEIQIRLGPDFSGATKRGGRRRVFLSLSPVLDGFLTAPSRCGDFLMNFVPKVEREGHSRQVSRHLSH